MTKLEKANKRIEELENGLKSIGGYILVWPPREAVNAIDEIVERLVGETTNDLESVE